MSLFKLAMSNGAPIILEPLHTSATKASSSELHMLHADRSVQQNQTKHRLMDLKCVCFFWLSQANPENRYSPLAPTFC